MVRVTSRRAVLGSVGTVVTVGAAGCLGDDDDEDGDDHTDHGDHADHDHGDDEDDGDDSGNDNDVPTGEGVVYAFAPNTIAVIDPDEGEVVAEITEGIDDESWGDPQITHDFSQVFVIRESPSQVLAIDTASHEVVAEIDIGPGPTHMYHPNDQEIWAHADDEGTFYVIDVESHDVVATVEAGLDAEGHGKLLYHEDFGDTGYATNVNDPGLPVLDMSAYERSDFIEFGEEGGTHYKAYSPQTGLIYGEFGDVTPVVDTESHDIVDELDFAGGMYLTPDDQLMGFLDGDTVRFVDVTDTDHEEVGSVEVEGGPDALRYHEADDGTIYAFTANTHSDQASVIDLDAFEVVAEIEVGHIIRPEDAPFLHRSGVAAEGLFVTPAEEDGFVALVDMEEHSLLGHVEVEEGVDTVQIIGDSGTGYTGRVR